MMKGPRPLIVLWREAIRDSRELDRTAKLVAHTLSTWMNPTNGHAWPSRRSVSEGAGLGTSCHAVDTALRRLEATGFLVVERSSGGAKRVNSYLATLPPTVHAVNTSTAHGVAETAHGVDENGSRGEHEVVKEVEKEIGGERTAHEVRSSPPQKDSKRKSKARAILDGD
jgi:hypothetical protein